jgi:hypothetical protein
MSRFVILFDSCFEPRFFREMIVCSTAHSVINGDIGDELFKPLRTHFSDKEIVIPKLAAIAINNWKSNSHKLPDAARKLQVLTGRSPTLSGECDDERHSDRDQDEPGDEHGQE